MGNHTSFPAEGSFERSSTTSPTVVEEEDRSQFDTCDSEASSVTSTPGSEHDSSSVNVSHLKLESNIPNNSTFHDNLGTKVFEEPTDTTLFDSTKTINELESSVDSSSSSFNIISEQSTESIPEVGEQSTKSSEALLLECIDQMQVLLKGICFEPGNTQSVSDTTLESLNELHKAIGVCASHWPAFQHNENEGNAINQTKCSHDLSTNSIFTPSLVEACQTSDTTNANEASEVHEESILSKGADNSSIDGQSNSVNSDVVSSLALNIIGKTSVDNLSTFVQDQRQLVHEVNDEQNGKDRENECMFVAEKVAVQPLLLRSLSALQTTSGVDSLLTDAESCTGTFCSLYPDSQQQIFDDNKQSKCALNEKVPRVGLNPTVSQFKKRATPERPSVRRPIGLNDIMNDENSAATLGKAVIRNALAFEKYAVLFRQTLDNDVLTASIGRALCKNALLFESGTSSVEVDEQRRFQQQHTTNPTVDVSKGSKQDHVFASSLLCSDRNKENENPTVEHLFKQSASKRKLSTLEEETRRTKCLVLSQKSTVEMRTSHDTCAWNGVHIATKQGRKAKNYNPNNDTSLNATTSKQKTAVKKETLREIIMNGPRKETERVRLFQNENTVLDYDTLKDNDSKKERWTVIEKNNEDMLELEDSEDENAIAPLELPLHLKSKLNEMQLPQITTTKDTDDTLMEGSIACRTNQLDSITGIYYFTNQYVFCSICNSNIFNDLRVWGHMNGSTHKANVMNIRKTTAAIMSVSARLQSIWDQIDISLGRNLFCKVVKFENDTLTCILCEVEVSGRLKVMAHVSGEEHQTNFMGRIIYSQRFSQNISKIETPVSVHRKMSWPDSSSFISSDVSLSESEGSIAEWLPTSSLTRSATLESDLAGIYYFAKNYVFCSICNINMFNSSIVLGHLNAKSHLANVLLQQQIESNNQVCNNETKLNRIWNQIKRTLGRTLFHTVLCVDKNANFFCDLCNMHMIIPGHLNILDHVCGKKHNKEFFKRVLLPSCKQI